MSESMILGMSAFIALLPSSFFALTRRENRKDGPSIAFWLTLGVAVAGPLTWSVVQISGEWRTGLSTALWVTIAASMLIFAVVTILAENAWRLTPLLSPYMAVLALLALIWQQAPETRPLTSNVPDGWIGAHILVSVVTYALVTIASVSSLAAFMQERALKSKQPTALTRLLPSVAESEWLMVRLLMLGEFVMALGLATGIATQYQETGIAIQWDHKTILSVTAFLVIGGLLAAHYISGVRGRLVARFMLLAYLLLTLGYPGVKFVTDILIG